MTSNRKNFEEEDIYYEVTHNPGPELCVRE